MAGEYRGLVKHLSIHTYTYIGILLVYTADDDWRGLRDLVGWGLHPTR